WIDDGSAGLKRRRSVGVWLKCFVRHRRLRRPQEQHLRKREHMSRARFLEVGQDRFGRRGFLAGLTLIGVGALAACGSGGGSASSSPDNSAATAAARVSSGLNAQASAAQSAGNAAGGTTVKM